ncbi:MAG: MFS transporter [Nocardioidaceae bacterium]
MTTTRAAEPRLREHLALSVGTVAMVTLAAFADRAVGTALPTVVRDFDALATFGLANAAPAASFLVALAVAGAWADGRGPLPVLRTGVAAFGLAQLLVGLAWSMPAVVVGRLASGFAEGLIDVSLMVLVAHALPAALRPRMFSLVSAAWVLPSVLGPVVTGVVTEQLGWRWVFLGVLLLVGPTWLLLRPAVGSAATTPVPDTATVGLGWALLAGAGVLGLSLSGEHLSSVAGWAALVVSAALLFVSVVRLLPPGTLRGARGLPTVVAVRGLVSLAFGGVGAFLPLLLTLLHGFRPVAAGISLTVTGVMWAVGSWVQGRFTGLPRGSMLRLGLLGLTVGLAVSVLLAVPSVAPVWGLIGWGLAGVGMGISSSTLSVLVLDLSRDAEQGRSNGAAQTAAAASMAVGLAFGGALVASASPTPGPVAFAVLLGTGTLAAATGLLLTPRATRSR